LPIKEIKRELDYIEIQQQGLERQGVRLEQIIREKCEGPDIDLNASLSIEVEDLVLQLFEVVNEKNELFRKQAELMYL
jgi:MICAL-like protein 1